MEKQDLKNLLENIYHLLAEQDDGEIQSRPYNPLRDGSLGDYLGRELEREYPGLVTPPPPKPGVLRVPPEFGGPEDVTVNPARWTQPGIDRVEELMRQIADAMRQQPR